MDADVVNQVGPDRRSSPRRLGSSLDRFLKQDAEIQPDVPNRLHTGLPVDVAATSYRVRRRSEERCA